MSSVRSHFRHRAQQQQPLEQVLKPASRIPTKSTSVDNGKATKPTQHAKLAKKPSKHLRAAEAGSSKNGTARTETPITVVAQPPSNTGKRVSVSPAGTTLSAAPHNMRTPSLVSGSSASTFDSPRSALRRMPSGAIDRYAAKKRNHKSADGPVDGMTMIKHAEVDNEQFEDTVLGLSLPATSTYGSSISRSAISGYELVEDDVVREFTPPTLGIYAPSATPSTRYTDSPFSHVPTPSSASSYSSSMLATSSNPPRLYQTESPRRAKSASANRSSIGGEAPRSGLLPVREASTSSSNSTVRTESNNPPSLTSRTINSQVPTKTVDESESRFRKIQSPVQNPPELAHLNFEVNPNTAAKQKSPPPRRPSRDGTSTISDMSRPSLVVQSDLSPLYTTYHKRTPSQETPVSNGSPSLKSRFGFSKSSSRHGTPRIDSAISPPSSARNLGNDTALEAPRREAAKLRRKDSPAMAAAPSPEKSSRFGLFSRKSKSEPPKLVEKPKRQPSKGPAAGTGHEGYGRFGARGRSGSVASSSAMSSGVRSPSSNSSASSLPRSRNARKISAESKDGSELDDFLRERLNPVILRGSGSTASNAAPSSYLPEESLQPNSSKASSLESLPRPRLLPSAMSGSSIDLPAKRPSVSRHTTSDSSDDEYAARYGSIAARRSMTRMSSAGGGSPVRVPRPINTDILAHHTSVDSYDAENSAWPQTDSTLPPLDQTSFNDEALWLRSAASNGAVLSSPKRNFLQRATASPGLKGKEVIHQPIQSSDGAVRQSPFKGVAHYAMLGQAAPIALEEVQRIALENETSADESTSGSFIRSKLVPYERRHVSLLPSPPSPEQVRRQSVHAVSRTSGIKVQRQDSAEGSELHSASANSSYQSESAADNSYSSSNTQPTSSTMPVWTDPRQLVSTPEPMQGSLGTPEQSNNSPRQPRLSPVGRIPQVISRRDRDRRLPDNSFSRPFARSQPRPSVKPPGSIYNQIRDMASPIEAASQPLSSTSTRSDVNSSGPKSSAFTDPISISTTRTSMDVHNQDEFIAFPARKNSEQSYSSSSHGHPSWTYPLATQPQQEDVWDEYNDLLDDVMPIRAPLKTPTTGSSFGAPFQYSSMLYESTQPQWPPYSSIGSPPTSELPLPPGSDLRTKVLSVPQQISRFLQPSMSPLSPDTIIGFIGGYGNRSTSTLLMPERASGNSQHRASIQQYSAANLASVRDSAMSSRYSQSSVHSRSSSLPEGPVRHSRSSMISVSSGGQPYDAQLSGIAEIPADKKAVSTNLRLGALMTSKWLSFGRVLFSPAHNEMQFAQERRVLVVDGLSSDWSYYVALSYPSAEVYNLTPSMPGSPSFTWPDDIQKPPSNHRQIPHGKIGTPFPFPKGFFTAVVFRFPTATTHEAYVACIAECKRVLRPGGYLEVAVLDLDLMNMGTKARSAVRGLKTRMQQRDPSVSLRNISDVLVASIGRRGFEAVQRCIVGVPAAGRIPRSQDMSSISSGSSGKPVTWRRERSTTKSQEISFADLLDDAHTEQFGPGRSNDESITKMVAKVGRWWYTTCYEKALLPSDQSIWNDPSLLQECERQGTSFRLLICHAQKPLQPRRRTVSV